MYDIIDDAQQEDDPDPQTDGVMSSASCGSPQGCIDVSTALAVDATERATWKNILTHLAPFQPTPAARPALDAGETVFQTCSA